MPWINAQVAYLLAVWWATATIEDGKADAGDSEPSEFDEIVTTKDNETIDAFSSHVIHARTRTAHWKGNQCDDSGPTSGRQISTPGPDSTKPLYGVAQCSKNVAVVVGNSMAYSQTQRKKTSVARTVTVTWVPEPPVQTGLTEASEGDHGHQMPKLTVKQRQEKLFEELDLSGLESWPPELAASAQSLLAKYHNIFSLDPSELGCTHSSEHVIKVTNDTPTKEWFRQIPPPLVENIHTHSVRNVGCRCDSPQPECVV